MKHKVLRNLSYGMYVVGAKDEKENGCIVNTVVQITSDPAVISVSINHDNYTNELIKKTKKFSVSILGEQVDPKIIGTFGYQSGRDLNKYENIETEDLSGLPVLKDSCGTMICRVINIVETTTHTIFLGEVISSTEGNMDQPMTYRYYHEVLKGKSPKNAPTYVEESTPKKTVWKCKVCGYEVEMDELPSDYRCPICGQPITAFERIEK